MRASQAWLALAAVVTFAVPAARAQESFANEDIGYRMRLPDGYKKGAGSFSAFGFAFGGDKYLLDSFESSKKISLPNGWTLELAMYTLWFPARSAAEIKKAELEAEKSASEKKDGETAVVIMGGGRIYQSFEEYAKNTWTGFYFGEEKKQTIAGFPAVLRPMIFEKLQQVPQEWMSCTLAVPGGEFAIVCSAPQSHVDKLRAGFMNAFKSFKVMRPEGLKIPPLNDNNIAIKEGAKIDRDTMSPDEIKKALADDRKKAYEKALAKVDKKTWSSFETENYLVIYETDAKYAQLAGRQAEDVRKWVATNFAGIGDGFEQSAILKIYRYDSSNTDAEFELFGFGSGPIVEEINFRQPESKDGSSEFASLNQSVMSNWFRQKNQELWRRMPRWLSQGLYDCIDDAQKAGGKLRFEPEEWERDAMIEAFRAQEKWEKEKSGEPPLKDVEDLLKMTGEEMWKSNSLTPRAQCASVVRYLVIGPGSRGKSGAIIRNYIKHLYELVQDVEKKLDAERKERMKGEVEKDGLSDEEKLAAEDEAYKKKRKDALDNVEKTLLEKTFAQTFEGWEDADWRSFQHSWLQYAEGKSK